MLIKYCNVITVEYSTLLPDKVNVFSKCTVQRDGSCILTSFKGRIIILHYVRATISVVHDLPKIASIYSLNGKALLSQHKG